jgi:hypothetical protein
MWLLFGTGAAPDLGVLGRLDVIEDEVQRFDRRWLKLQGEFNASLRRQAQLERENDALEDEVQAMQEGE